MEHAQLMMWALSGWNRAHARDLPFCARARRLVAERITVMGSRRLQGQNKSVWSLSADPCTQCALGYDRAQAGRVYTALSKEDIYMAEKEETIGYCV